MTLLDIHDLPTTTRRTGATAAVEGPDQPARQPAVPTPPGAGGLPMTLLDIHDLPTTVLVPRVDTPVKPRAVLGLLLPSGAWTSLLDNRPSRHPLGQEASQ